MTGSDKPDERIVKFKVKKLKCRRTGQMYTVAEHVQCPYCYGDGAAIEEGQETWEAGSGNKITTADHFGFPPDSTRTQRG